MTTYEVPTPDGPFQNVFGKLDAAEAGRAEGQEGDGYLEVPPPKVRGYMTAIPRGELARLRATEALIAKWRAEQEEYPKSDCGPYAAAVLKLCADELEAALTGQDPDPQDYEHEHREMNR